MRWIAPNGVEWDSRWAYEVFRQIETSAPGSIRPTTPGVPGESDTLTYSERIRHGSCDACGGTSISKHRVYTPDLFYLPSDACAKRKRLGLSTGTSDGYYVETKGYLRANKRSLLRAFHKARKDVAIRYILQRDYKVTKSLSAVGWITKFLKCPVIVWDGKLPKEWV